MRRLLAFMLSGFLFFTSCDDDGGDDGDEPGVGGIEVLVESNISSEITWSSDSVYILAGRITVLDGATLTIEPGTIIKGQAGTGTNATALLVARGGTLIADGEASAPIIFTSIADEITPELVAAGNFVSPNLDPDIDGLWGGVIVLGSANISASNDNDEDVSEVQIEGIPTSDTNGLYGGTDDAEGSSILDYVSIRHGGSNIGQGNEINGLTLGGVGTGTTISNIEVVANQDDGIEWFGGTVNASNVLIWNAGDDGLDTDQAWNGTCDGFIIVTPRNGSAFELDGPEGTYVNGNHTFSNGIVYAGDLGEELIDFDDDTNADMSDIYFYGFVSPIIVESYADMAANGGSVGGFEYTFPATYDDDGDEDTAEVPFVGVGDVFVDIDVALLTEVDANQNTVGPNSSAFSWTWAGASGALGEIGL